MIDDILEWTRTHAEGWTDGVKDSWTTYYPEEQRVLVEYALERVPVNGVIVEIGSYSGLSSSLLLQVARQKNARIIIIDPLYWVRPYAEPLLRGILCHFPDVQWRWYATTSILAYNCVIQGDEPWLPIDFLHIDANHEYRYVLEDSRLWSPFVAHGGVIAWHDIFMEGVRRGVKETCGDWPVLHESGQWGIQVRQKP